MVHVNRRFERPGGCEAWTDGRISVVLYDNGTLARYEGKDLVWFHPSRRHTGRGTIGLAARFGAFAGWPSGAVDVAGRHVLRDPKGDGTLSLRDGWLPSGRRLGPGSRLCSSPWGVVLADPDISLLYDLEHGVYTFVPGVHARLCGARTSRGFVAVSGSADDEEGELSSIGALGEQLARRALFRPRAPWVTGDAVYLVHQPSPSEERWYLEGFDIDTLESIPRSRIVLPDDVDSWAFSSHGAHAIATGGDQCWLFEDVSGDVRKRSTFSAPTGDPTELAGPSRIDPIVLRWQGAPGTLRLEGMLVNRGQNAHGLALHLQHEGAWTAERWSIADEHTEFVDSIAHLPGAILPLDIPTPFSLEGTAFAEGRSVFALCCGRRTLGEITIDVSLAHTLRCVRGEEMLSLDPEWVEQLHNRGLLDVHTPTPDLARWQVRAEVSAERDGGSPELVRQRFLEFTEDERSQRAVGDRICAFKFTHGGPWVITEEEAELLAYHLGSQHPLGQFARGGAFWVQRG